MQYKYTRRERMQLIFSGFGKSAVIYPAGFLVTLGGGMLNLGIVFFMREVFSSSTGMIGWLLGIGTLSYALGCIFLKPVFLKFKPKYLMICASAGMTIFLILLRNAISIPLIFLFFGLEQLFLSLFWPPAIGWLAQGRTGDSLNKVMSRFNMSWSSGLFISPSLAGWLSEMDPGLPITGAIIVYFCMFILTTGAAFFLPSIRCENKESINQSNTDLKEERKTPFRFSAWIGLFVFFLITGMVMAIFPIHARDSLNISKSTVGNIMSVRILIRVAAFYILGRFTFWHFNGKYQMLTTAVLAVLLLIMMEAKTVWVFILLISFISMNNAFSYSNSMFHSLAGSSGRAGSLAIHEALLSLGFISGSTVSGMLYQSFSFQAVILFCVICCGITIVVQAIIIADISRKRIKRNNR